MSQYSICSLFERTHEEGGWWLQSEHNTLNATWWRVSSGTAAHLFLHRTFSDLEIRSTVRMNRCSLGYRQSLREVGLSSVLPKRSTISVSTTVPQRKRYLPSWELRFVHHLLMLLPKLEKIVRIRESRDWVHSTCFVNFFKNGRRERSLRN